MIPLSTKAKEAIKTGLALALVYGIALKSGWMNPYWAGFAVAMISLRTAGQSFHKGILRCRALQPSARRLVRALLLRRSDDRRADAGRASHGEIALHERRGTGRDALATTASRRDVSYYSSRRKFIEYFASLDLGRTEKKPGDDLLLEIGLLDGAGLLTPRTSSAHR